jgi:transposase
MPWHTRNLVEEREAFANLAKTSMGNFSRLCQSFGISRRVGYKWLSRYRQAGEVRARLEDQSRRPHQIHEISQPVKEEVLKLRAEHGWGPLKLARALKSMEISIARSTIYKIIKEYGRISKDDPEQELWIHQILVSDNPQLYIEALVP